MLYNKFLFTSIYCVIFASAATAETEAAKEFYNLPDEATCRNNFCVDKDEKPITGILRRYKNGFIVREYNVENGYLEGKSHAFYENGNIKTERNYKKGQLDGMAIEYEKDGTVTQSISYKNGEKDGISTYYTDKNIIKIIYINDKMTGDTQIWDKNSSKLIYKLKMQNDMIESGTYSYQNQENLENNEEIELTPLIIEGKNHECLEFHNNLTITSCMVKIEPTIAILSQKEALPGECDNQWFATNKTELVKYIKSCKCNDLKNEIKVIYNDTTKDQTTRKEQLLELKDKYQQHCMETNEQN